MKPTVSVIMPAYNVAPYVAEAIDSVLAQTLPAWEILVVNDGSTDGTGDILRGYGDKIRVFSQPNQGIGAGRNTAIRHATGEWLAFLDCDDVWLPHRLERPLSAHAADPTAEILLSYYLEMTADGVVKNSQPKTGEHINGTMVRRHSFMKVGPFGTQWKLGEFIDWMARARHAGLRSILVPVVLNHRRIHPESTVMRQRQSYGDYVTILKQSLDRRRSP